jgi:hypothetical protein
VKRFSGSCIRSIGKSSFQYALVYILGVAYSRRNLFSDSVVGFKVNTGVPRRIGVGYRRLIEL